jgi:lipid II:glycine glycyltransferase (peptidoglycan interpeptide bridge formation enzyme)
VTPETPQKEWDSFLSDHPDCHLLQSSAWGELKSSFGWSVYRIVKGNCGAQILFRSLPFGYTIAYIPKGPIGPWLPELLPDIDKICHDHKAIFLKVEPDTIDNPKLAENLHANGFRQSHQTIQPLQTLIVNLQGSEEDILARMRQKTRYNIRLAGRKGVEVRPWEDLDGFSNMMQETGTRDEFGVHSPGYYKKAYELFYPHKTCELFVAEFDRQPLAAIFVFTSGHRAWYFYGASTAIERNRMPTYLLQWEAMKWAVQKGCTEYDLWGIPAEDEETLERYFTSRSDGLWGVYRFKRGFGGRPHSTIGAWDRPYNRPLYSFYRLISSRVWNS